MMTDEPIRVLVVDDEPMVNQLIQSQLTDLGHAVAGAAFDGPEAVALTCQLRPDVVLMDLQMPDPQTNQDDRLAGLRAVQMIQEQCPTPVILLTAHESPELIQRASDAGVGAYIVKPSGGNDLDRAIAITRARFNDSMELRRLNADLQAEITERKRAEAALKQYSERLEEMIDERTAELEAQYAWLDTILGSTTDGIVVTNEKGSIAHANPVAQAWLTQTLSPEEAARLREAIRSVVTRAEEQPVEMLELTGLDLELSAALVVEERAEKPAAAVVDIHDVSHLKSLERMKNRFITNISHELRTPITTIKLYTYLMRQHPEEWEQYLDVLAQEVEHQVRLLEGILEISRLDAGRIEMEPRPTSLNELTEVTIVRHRAAAQEHELTLEHHPAEPGPVTMVDPERMMQVLSNLVGNAIRYTPAGGKVMLSTGTDKTKGRTWATVTVADTGMGIPEDELPHLFDRFFRGEKPRSMQLTGTGLGLAIVKEIVELHGGRVTVQSQVDVGSTLTVWLPLGD
jgi:signal transduction histidine kinase